MNQEVDIEQRLIGPPHAELMKAEMLRRNDRPDDAMRVVAQFMNDNYDNVQALMMGAHIMIDADRKGVAQAFLRLASVLRPEIGVIWNNLGLCYQENDDYQEGIACLTKALHRNPKDAMALNNLGQIYNNTGQPLKALNCIDRAIELDPELVDAQWNRGIAKLMLGEWREGWRGYEWNLGKHAGRRERTYGAIPRWTGIDGCKLIAYGEQGLGDEISFASCLPDLMKNNEVIIECDKRLEFLFRRSFPCKVYGTRFTEGILWPNKEKPEASVAFGSLPGFYRNTDKDFPGTPYLVADPERRVMYRALLDSLGPKLKVGIAWAGGKKGTAQKERSMPLYDMMPILKQDATFISLQYKDASEVIDLENNHNVKVHHWAHACQTMDYDDTAALVAELDLIITVTTSVVHLAGALGTPCWALVPKAPMWRYRMDGDTFLWATCVKLYRQKTADWVYVIAQVARDLREHIQCSSR